MAFNEREWDLLSESWTNVCMYFCLPAVWIRTRRQGGAVVSWILGNRSRRHLVITRSGIVSPVKMPASISTFAQFVIIREQRSVMANWFGKTCIGQIIEFGHPSRSWNVVEKLCEHETCFYKEVLRWSISRMEIQRHIYITTKVVMV